MSDDDPNVEIFNDGIIILGRLLASSKIQKTLFYCSNIHPIPMIHYGPMTYRWTPMKKDEMKTGIGI